MFRFPFITVAIVRCVWGFAVGLLLSSATFAACPYGMSLSDSCPSQEGDYVNANFFNYENGNTGTAAQSGQKYSKTITGTISGGVLTVTSAPSSSVFRGQTLALANEPRGIYILSQTSGSYGGTGTYTLANSTGITVNSPTSMAVVSRPDHNMPGVDYGVGTLVSHDQLVDPEFATPNQLPVGCIFSKWVGIKAGALAPGFPAADSPVIDGGLGYNNGTNITPVIYCYFNAPSEDFEITGLNLGPIGDHTATSIYIDSRSAANSITISNSYFLMDSSNSNNADALHIRSTMGAFISSGYGGNYLSVPLTLKNIEFDGQANQSCCNSPGAKGVTSDATGANPMVFNIYSNSTIDVVYSAFFRWPGHLYGVNGPALAPNFRFCNNFVDGIHFRAAGGHGEMGNNSSGDNTICNNTILTESSEESVLTSLLVGATVPITINSNDTYGNAFVTNRDGGSSAPATANIGVSVHMVSGTMIIDNVQGLNGMDIGTASIAPGMAVYGTDAILRSYVGQFKPGGTPNGLYSMWTTDCGAASISGVSASMCPLASPTGGIFNNTEGNFSPSYSNSMTSGVGGYVLDLLWATVTKKVLYKTNWIDPSGASLGILSTGNGACKNGSDLTGNVNMLTGDGSGVTVWSTTPGPGC